MEEAKKKIILEEFCVRNVSMTCFFMTTHNPVRGISFTLSSPDAFAFLVDI